MQLKLIMHAAYIRLLNDSDNFLIQLNVERALRPGVAYNKLIRLHILQCRCVYGLS